VKLVLTLLASAAISTLSAGPKAPGTPALSRGMVVEPAAEEDVEGVGSLRRLPAITADTIGPFETSVSDNSRFWVLRIRTGDVPAARLYIRDMALPAGALLMVYGVDGDGVVTNVFGPVHGAGPLNSGEFWTDVIVGSEIVVELQVVETLPDIPFEVVGLSPADAKEAMPYVEPVTSEHRTSLFRGRALTHAVENGMAIYEGDIELGNADELPRADARSKKAGKEAVAITGARYRWPGGIIPYVIDPAVVTPTRVTNAVAHWNTVMSGYVEWIPRTNETAYVSFMRAASSSTCSSSVGMTGYKQIISVGDICSTGNVIHEMGHAVGLWHEQTREDRDGFIKILWDNLQSGVSYNFTQNISYGDDMGPYDYGSIMHYPAVSFSVNGKPTIETIPAGIGIGQRGKLSAGDIAAVRAMYPRAGVPDAPSVTIDSIPAGQTITVDGVNYKTPKTFQWTPGSIHSLAAINPAIVSGTRNAFVRWTDGGAQAHTVVAPLSPTTYRADYATSYSAVFTAAAPGTVAVSPISADTFYAKSTSLALEAVVPAGYCFTSWTGLAAGTPVKTALTVSKAYTVQANYAPGSISIMPAALTVPLAASTQQIAVDATAGCVWTASSPVTWAKITAGSTGAGAGVVTVSVTSRSKTAAVRSATLTIAGKPVVVTQ
jgi:hypothetical protein